MTWRLRKREWGREEVLATQEGKPRTQGIFYQIICV